MYITGLATCAATLGGSFCGPHIVFKGVPKKRPDEKSCSMSRNSGNFMQNTLDLPLFLSEYHHINIILLLNIRNQQISK